MGQGKSRRKRTVARILVFSPDMKYVLVQARGRKKDLGPGALTHSAGGHVSGEEKIVGGRITQRIVTETMQKELFEKTGIKDSLGFEQLPHFHYRSNPQPNGIFGNREIVFLFSGTYEGKVSPNYSEVGWLGWFSVEGIRKLGRKRPDMFAGDMPTDLERILSQGRT